MRFYIAILLLFMSVIIGLIFSEKYKKRKDFFFLAVNFNNELIGEVNFSKKTIPDILSGQDNRADFYKTLNSYYNGEKTLYPYYIKPDEKKYLESYFNGLGVYDKLTQNEKLKNAENVLNKYYSSSLEEDGKYRLLSIKISLLIGIIFFIVII